MGGACNTHERDEICKQNFSLRPEGKRPLGMDPGKIGWEGVDWMHLADDRDHWRYLVNTIMKLRIKEKW
jgi:hypothetical protein